ncbi:MAG: hypothetical protein COV66_09315 [Nitrospinae bacterium CG11_big_fil_rev_8_21_14_0_20_45_15]|nr:MAG: hypothetical protein COV66_09315 [Nitrospinae bacterium CG11_big_fil_rev_8_21_14_0_20_45_15]
MTSGRFIDNKDGTITDSLTSLMWMQEDSFLRLKKFITYPQALKLLKKTNEESFAGYSDWRLPDKHEAYSIYLDRAEILDKYDMVVHLDSAFSPGCGYNTWTSHARGNVTAYCFSFGNGTGGHKETEDNLNDSVRFVRGVLDTTKYKKKTIPQPKDVITRGGGWR